MSTGRIVHIDTSLSTLSDFDIDGFLQSLGLENELKQLNIDINSGFDLNFQWDEQAMEEMLQGLKNIEMPAIPEVPEIPELEGMGDGIFFSDNKAVLGVYSDDDAQGAKISSLVDEGAALAAGLQEGDIITKVDERTVESSNNLREIIGLYEPGAVVTVTYIRDGAIKTTQATLKENEHTSFNIKFDWPDSNGFQWNDDMEKYMEMHAETHGFLGVFLEDKDAGSVVISGVQEGSAAEDAGLQEGDVIKMLNDTKIESYEAVIDFMENTKPGDVIKVTYEREGKTKTTNATLQEVKNKVFHFEHGETEGTTPMIFFDHVAPCPPGSAYAYASSDGKKTVQICITAIKDAPSENKDSDHAIMHDDHPLMDPNNVQVYSNPSNGAFHVQFNVPDAGDVRIIITDINGSEVYTETLNNFSGGYNKEISLENAPKGTYFVKVSQNGYSSTKTVIVQ